MTTPDQHVFTLQSRLPNPGDLIMFTWGTALVTGVERKSVFVSLRFYYLERNERRQMDLAMSRAYTLLSEAESDQPL